MTTTHTKLHYWLYVFLLLGGILRLWGLGDKSFWVDELRSVYDSKEFDKILQLSRERYSPPLRTYMIHYLARSARPESFVRLPSALAGIAAILFLFLLARYLLNEQIALLSVVLLTVSPLHVLHSQDGRMYAVFLLLVIMSLYLMFLGLRRRKLIYWAMMGIVMVVNAYLTYIAFLPIMMQMLFVIVLLLFPALQTGKPNCPGEEAAQAHSHNRRALLCHGAVAFALVGVLYLPWAYGIYRARVQAKPQLSPIAQAPQSAVTSMPASSPDDIATRHLEHLDSLLEPTTPTVQEPVSGDLSTKPGTADHPGTKPDSAITTAPAVVRQVRYHPFRTVYSADYFLGLLKQMSVSHLIPALLMLAFAAVGAGVARSRNRSFFVLCVIWFTLPFIILFFLPMREYFYHRYFMYLQPVYLILAAAGVWWLAQKVSRLQSKTTVKNPLAWIVALVLLMPYLTFAAKDDWDYFHSEKQNWRGAMRYLESQLQPNDVVIAGQAWSELGVLYYATGESRKARIFIRINDAGTVIKMICEPHSVWYINWGPLPEILDKQVKRFLTLRASFPGMHGDINVYHKPADPDQLRKLMQKWQAHPELF